MKQLEKLFTFPIIMIDGDEEDKKEKRGFTIGDDEPEIIYGEAEVPFDAFLSISDRWIPVESSRERAKEGLFDACLVVFEVGSFLVPWTREKFKKRLTEFSAGKDVGSSVSFLDWDTIKRRMTDDSDLRERD